MLPLSFAATHAADAAALASGKSPNWSGYAMRGNGFTSVSGSWIVPTVVATTERQGDATWVGIGGLGTADLIQVGTRGFTTGGTVTYEAWYELLPAVSTRLPLAVAPGQNISASITEIAPDSWLLAIANQATGASYSTVIRYRSSHASAEWIEEMPRATDGPLALAKFGTLSFSRLSSIENGVARAPEAAQAFTMIDKKGRALATPSVLTDSSFTITRNR